MAAEWLAQVRRLPALWALYARMDLLWILRGPYAALSWLVADVIIACATVASTFLLAARFDGIGAWSRPQVLFMLGVALAVRGLLVTIFGFNVAFPSRRIGRGQLDHMLLMPQPLALVILADGFSPLSGSAILVGGFGVIAWAIAELGIALTPAWVGLLALYLASSTLVVLAFSYVVGSLAFVAPRAAEEINSETWRLVHQIAPFPLDGVGAALTVSLLSFAPAGLVAWLPSRVLLGFEATSWALLWMPLAAGAFALVAVSVFRLGLAHYGRTGSSRYLSHGHRR
jgi:ABC-2 type transport system permease protein